MSLWSKLLQSGPETIEQVRQFYGNNFPLEVRHHLSDWLEKRLFVALLEDDPQYNIEATLFLNELLGEMERKATEMSFDEQLITESNHLRLSARTIQQNFSNHPCWLYSHFRNCLMLEKQICYSDQYGINQRSEYYQINQELKELMTRVRSNENKNRTLKKLYELFCCELHQGTRNNAQFNSQAPALRNEMAEKMQQQQINLQHSLNYMTGVRIELVDKFKETIQLIESVQQKVINDYLDRWCMSQGLGLNGVPQSTDYNLDVIQGWFEQLAEILWSTRGQIKLVSEYRSQLNVDEGNLPDFLPELLETTENLLEHLVTRSFIIEKQPPQVLKTQTRFSSTVRFLTGNSLNIKINNPMVKVTIVSEEKALQTQQTNKCSDSSSGEIINNTGHIDYNEKTKKISVSFLTMQLKKIKRAEKKGNECVKEEKFALLFQSNFHIGDLEFFVWSLSLPVVVVVHSSQEPQALATIFWDYAFAEYGRLPFVVPEKVSWNQLAEALNVKFRASTGRNLTPENLHFLCEKAFRIEVPMPPIDDYQITWSQFCKEPLPDRNFTFWDWFYAAMKLTQSEHLREPWIDGAIVGFIHKKTAEDLLLKCNYGTFLLRFSDSELGGLSIAWVGENIDNNSCVLHIQPFKADDFKTRTLSDRISDFEDLTTIYPNREKKDFEKYTKPTGQPVKKDYVRIEIHARMLRSDLNNSMTPAGTSTLPDPLHNLSPISEDFIHGDTNDMSMFLTTNNMDFMDI